MLVRADLIFISLLNMGKPSNIFKCFLSILQTWYKTFFKSFPAEKLEHVATNIV